MSVLWTTCCFPNHSNKEVFKIKRQKNGKVAPEQRAKDGRGLTRRFYLR